MRGLLTVDPHFYSAVLAGIFGVAFGSFLNVCVYRIPRDLSVVTPRSFCPECGMQIAWYDNIPLVSYAVLAGRSRCCRKPIGIRYPVVELCTAAAFAAVALRFGPTAAALKWLLFEAILIVLFWTDLEERILPDELTLGGTALGFLFAPFVAVPGVFGELLVSPSRPLCLSLVNAVLGAILLAGPMWLLALLYEKLRKREGLGLGDVKLLMLLGVFLGFEEGVAALLVAAVAGSVIGVVYILLRHKAALTYELPFGAFLCAGAALTPFLNSTGYPFSAR